jgi:hypothetical protein
MNTNQKALLIARAMIKGESGTKAGGRVNIQADYARRLVKKVIRTGLAKHRGDQQERNIKAYQRNPHFWLKIVDLAAKAWGEK